MCKTWHKKAFTASIVCWMIVFWDDAHVCKHFVSSARHALRDCTAEFTPVFCSSVTLVEIESFSSIAKVLPFRFDALVPK